MERPYTTDEAAKRLGCSSRTARRVAEAIGVARDGHGKWAWSVDDLKRGREELAARRKREYAGLKNQGSEKPDSTGVGEG